MLFRNAWPAKKHDPSIAVFQQDFEQDSRLRHQQATIVPPRYPI